MAIETRVESSPLMEEEAVHQELKELINSDTTIVLTPDGGRRGGRAHFGMFNPLAEKLGHRKATANLFIIERHLRKYVRKGNLIIWGAQPANLERDEEEVQGDLLPLLAEGMQIAEKEAVRNGERIVSLGRREPLYDTRGKLLVRGLPDFLLERIDHALDVTKNNDGPLFGVAINYSGDDEMTRIYERFQAAKAENAKDPKRGIPQNTPFTPETWRPYGDDGGLLPPVTVMLRTAGGNRFSGFGHRTNNAELRTVESYITDVTSYELEVQLLDALKTEQRHGK